MLQVVVDTNVFARCISKRSPYNPIFNEIINGRLILIISNEIMSEYEEFIKNTLTESVYENSHSLIIESPTVYLVNPFYQFSLIKNDPDDNKFVDAAICANANFLITNDKDYKSANESRFPTVNVISPEEFIKKHLN
jgi:uncharacterized protein